MILVQTLNKKINKKRNLNQINLSIKSFFQAYSHALQSKAIFFEHPFLESALGYAFLNCLVKESRIVGYQFLKEKQKVNIFLSYDLSRKTPLIPTFTFYSSQGRLRICSLKTLQAFKRQNPTTLTLINAQGGILTLKDCLLKKCGGQLLVTIT